MKFVFLKYRGFFGARIQESISKVAITLTKFAGMKFCFILPGCRQCYKLFINYIVRLHVKCFILTRRDPLLYCRDEIFPCNHFRLP